jgi:thiamine biosynthesis protein ThiI
MEKQRKEYKADTERLLTMSSKKKALLLISSGIDSPVAGYLAKKHNLDIYGLYFFQGDSRGLNKVKKHAKKIGLKALFVANHHTVMKQVIKNCTPKYNCILCKRFMYRIASKLAKKNKYDFLVDGGNLGQVASQTLDNIILTQKVSEIPLLRPLLCNEKQETIDIAKDIGTFDISSEKEKGCCYVPKYPVTKTNERFLKFEEEKLDVSGIIEKTLSTIEKVKL